MFFEKNKAQVSIEYIIILGFVTFAIISVVGIAFFYSGSINDQIIITQISNFANKVISTAESVQYAGEPSKSTISVYLPDGVEDVEIIDDNIYITFSTKSGTAKMGFSGNVQMNGVITSVSGLKKLEIIALPNQVDINTIT